MTDQTTPSQRAGLRDEIANALEAADYRQDMRRGDLADSVMPVLYWAWPWLRAEAEEEAADPAALRDRIAAAVDEGFRLTAELEDLNLGDSITDAVLAVLPAPADRADVYAEVADRLAADAEQGAKEGFTRIYRRSAAKQVREWGDELRRRADEAQQPEAQAAEAPPVCEGFQWIGQSFATCDRCGQPAWEHTGEEVPVEGAGPFDTRRTVRPWKPGEADAIRAKWAPATAGEERTS